MADGEFPELPYTAELHKPPALLPIAQLKDQLLYTIETYPVTIVIGSTGAGKTTQIPKFLLDAGWCSEGKQIAITLPQDIAAFRITGRVAEEIGTSVGQRVGISRTFHDITSANTQLKFLNDALLLREMLVDPLLNRYSVIMVDEAHERSLSSDILLSLLKKVLKKRKDLRVVVSSATLETEQLLEFFAPDEDENSHEKSKEEYCKIIRIEEKAYPVEIQYMIEPTNNYVETAVETVMKIHDNEPDGDVLVFLTDWDEIDDAMDILNSRIADLPATAQKMLTFPLYAGSTREDQMLRFQKTPQNTRKVVLATNIAEASVNIDKIVYVVDNGYVKLRAYDAHVGIENFNTIPISKASATQRASRAGRTRAGKCFRLYTEAAYKSLEEVTVPEIQRLNLAPIILQLLNLGITNVIRFDYISSPPSTLVTRALDFLYSLGALDANARLTKPLGTCMAELPLDPMLSRALMNAANPEFGCLSEMITIAAMTLKSAFAFVTVGFGKKQVDAARRRFTVEEGDHLTLYNLYEAFVKSGKTVQFCRENCLNHKVLISALSIRIQLAAYLDRFGIKESPLASSDVRRAGGRPLAERICRCLATGFFAHAVRMKTDGSFTTVDGKTTFWAHPSSVFFHRKADWVVYTDIMETNGKVYIRDMSSVQMDWLIEYAPEYYKVKNK